MPTSPTSAPAVRAAPGRRSAPLLLLGAGLLLVAALALAPPRGSARAAAQPPAPAAPKIPAFDAARSFADLKKQVDFGPRVPNLKSHVECRDWLLAQLTANADRAWKQDLTRRLDGRELKMANLIATWKGSATGDAARGVLLCAHWDTRPTADYESTAERRATPIPGANDGASGVAVLLEIARLLKRNPPPVPVMVVLFDGEDFGPEIERMFLGSRYFADNLPPGTPKKGILLDMIGDRDLRVPVEDNSWQAASQVVRDVYAGAKALGYDRQFPLRRTLPIEDDHVQLHRKGLQVIDLIDFDYGPGHAWWHTLEDTPDKCSPDSLKATGDVVLAYVFSRR